MDNHDDNNGMGLLEAIRRNQRNTMDHGVDTHYNEPNEINILSALQHNEDDSKNNHEIDTHHDEDNGMGLLSALQQNNNNHDDHNGNGLLSALQQNNNNTTDHHGIDSH